MRLYGSHSHTLTLGKKFFDVASRRVASRSTISGGGAYCEPRRDAKNFGNHSEITSNTHTSFKYDSLYAFRYTECDNIAEMAIPLLEAKVQVLHM